MMSEMDKILDAAFPGRQCRIGLGTGDVYGRTTTQASLNVIGAALDEGIRYFDTARLYGDGTAEEVLGAALFGVRHEVIIASKAGIVPWSMRLGRRVFTKAGSVAHKVSGGVLPAPPLPDALYNAFDGRTLIRSVEASLNALKTDYLDILLLHECSLEALQRDDVQRTLETLKAAGKVRATGIAATQVETLRIMQTSLAPQLDVVQAPANILARQEVDYGVRSPSVLITHSTLRPVLDAVTDRLQSDADFRHEFKRITGADPNDTGALVNLLLAHAQHANPDGVVLFSTLKPQRINGLKTRVLEADLDAQRFAALEALMGQPAYMCPSE